MGDPAGIGPEVIVKALADSEIRRRARFVIYGLNEQLTYSADMAELNVYWWRDQHENINRDYLQSVVVADYDEINCPGSYQAEPGQAGGEASMKFISDAIDDAMMGEIDAIVTAPISKESWKLAGYKYTGHTELLTSKCKAKTSTL